MWMLAVVGCAGSAPEPAAAPRAAASAPRDEAPTPRDRTEQESQPHFTARIDIPERAPATATPILEPAEQNPPAMSAPPSDEPSGVASTDSPEAQTETPLERPLGGGSPLSPPVFAPGRPALPLTVRINPLRQKTSPHATAEPRILETRPRSELQMESAPPVPADAPTSPDSTEPLIAAPELPTGRTPVNDVPVASTPLREIAPRSVRAGGALVTGPRAPESTPTRSPDSLEAAAPPAGPRDRLVKVFYGTDRRAKGDPREFFEWTFGWVPGLLAAVVALLIGVAACWMPQHRLLLTVGASLAATVSGVLITRGPLARDLPPESSENGVEFTAERGRLSLGWCEVTIPPEHDPGEVESPTLLHLEVRPNPQKHVVLKQVVREEPDAFFDAVRQKVQQSPRHDLFLFVHGYNVSFEDAARRTAQMSFDLRFEGAAVFFSWPSQGELLKYTVDENNVAWSASHLKEFLLDVVRRTDARSVNLIAHSMGNRALGQAIRELEFELRQGDAIFDEVVLAAPDIDAGIFKRDIAPALRRTARHATLYASAHDQALVASKFVHGYPRAGDSGAGLVVVDGIDTVDVSRIDLSLLGHSYYGSSEPILEDLDELISESRRPDERKWLKPAERDGQKYWTFRTDLRNRRARMSRSTEPQLRDHGIDR